MSNYMKKIIQIALGDVKLNGGSVTCVDKDGNKIEVSMSQGNKITIEEI